MNPTLATALAVKDVGSLLSKFYKMREPFADMYAHLNDAPVFRRIYENISAATGRDVIGRFSLFKYPSDTDKHFGFDQKRNTPDELSLRTVFDAMANLYTTVVQREVNGNGFYFDVGDIRFSWYPVATTNGKPTIEIRKNGVVITKIRTI
jgi:hypothetical protein